MKKGLKHLLILAMLAAGAVLGQPTAFANCQDPGSIYSVPQCAGNTWFGPKPADAGNVQAAWWQLGFGNNLKAQVPPASAASASNGSGFQGGGTCTTVAPFTCTAGRVGQACVGSTTAERNCSCLIGFIGNDSGLLTGDPSLLDLTTAAPAGSPPGSMCFAAGANWTNSGSDGCVDNIRSAAAPKDDNHLNKYYNPGYYGYLSYDFQTDAPMGVLLTETNNKYYALAFFASRSRGMNPSDPSPGDFAMEAIGTGADRRGDANILKPGSFDVVPWQPIPGTTPGSASLMGYVNPSDTTSDRIIHLMWTPIRLVDDGSVRMSTETTANLGGANGVGVRDQPALLRYVVERAPLTAPATCGAYTLIGNLPDTATDTTVTVPRDTCIRLTTIFGRAPQLALTCSGTITESLANARLGILGDIGYQVQSTTMVGGLLVSEKAVLKVASRNKNALTVQFDTTSELSVTQFDVVGQDQKGGERVIGSLKCKECNTGRGSSYQLVIPAGDVKDSKKVVIVTRPSGDRSNALPIE